MKWQWFFSLFSVSWAGCPTDTICEGTFNKCYKYVEEEKDFFAAEGVCSGVGGHLVSISNAFEGSLILDSAQSMFTGASDYWIGANVENNVWSWIDGSQWSYTNWFPGQPNSYQAGSALLGSGLWSSSAQSSHKPFVCELPFSPSPSVTTCPRITCPTAPSCPATRSPCADGWFHFSETKSCYKIIRDRDWAEAENACQANSAHLVSVHSKAENDFIANFVNSGLILDYNGQIWMGLHRVSGIWRWSDDTTVDYVNWADDEPNSTGNDACGQLLSDEMSISDWNYYWKWNDRSCTDEMRAAVCKKPEM